MRFAAAFAALALASATQLTDAQAEENFKDRFAFTAEKKGDELVIKITPKEGWYVNTEYPMKIDLRGEGVELGKDKLRKADARFEDSGKEGKAKKATFKTSAKGDGKVSGEYKLVVCSDNNCSPPIKGEFSAK